MSAATLADIAHVAEAVVVIGGALIAGVAWLIRRGRRDEKLDELLTQVRPNGGKSDQLGDIAKRTEAMVADAVARVADLSRRFDRHIGHSDAVEDEIFERLDRLEGS